MPGTVDNTAFFGTPPAASTAWPAPSTPATTRSSIRREPIGVVGSIAPWNYPLQMAAWKVLPAIAAGNTIVLKPAEITPLTSILFAEAFTEAGAPAGVVNVVTGTGPVAGQHLVGHPDVAMTSFTGSTDVGAPGDGHGIRHRQARAPRARRQGAVRGLRRRRPRGGRPRRRRGIPHQRRAGLHRRHPRASCTARVHDAFVQGVADLMAAVRIGPTGDEATDLGPLELAGPPGQGGRHGRAGPRLRQGRHRRRRPPPATWPAAATTSRPWSATSPLDSEIWRDEVFGPVLVVVAFDDDDEAIRLANDTEFGLAASAWTRDTYRAGRATREIRAGCVWVNDHIPIISEMPHGGYRHSGFGKDMSAYSFDEYTNIKHVMHDNTAVAHKPWHRTIFTLPG